jgi:trk system potassium uptake protein TrkH
LINAARLRRALWRESIGVDVGAALNLVGALIRYLSLTFLFPAAIAVGYDEPAWPFLVAGLITAAAGSGLGFATRGKERVGAREGYLVVALVWLLVAAFGCLPYLFSGEDQLSHPVDAYFESMSGFSTTGASVLTDIEGLEHSLAMWRQFTQWLGGMGIIVLALVVLPRLRVGGRQLFEVEAPGPEVEPLTISIREAARRFVVLYIGFSILELLVLSFFAWSDLDERMSFYEAVAHAFTTLPTGGFSTEARSIEAFGAATQWAIVGFMVVAGTNFALMYRSLVRRRPGFLVRDDEFRLYVILLVLASAILLVEIWSEEIAEGEAAVRHAVFQTVSLMTTTGYASADFNEWTFLSAMLLVALMFASASAGSTSGSIKLARHVLIGRMLRRELDQTIHPELVTPIRFNGAIVDERALRAVIVFVLLYVGVWAAGAGLIALDGAQAGTSVSPFDVIAASATTLGGVGPGFGFAGPMGSFAPFSDASKGIMIVLMWLGRLEIIPVAVLLTRAYWRA